MKMLKIHFDFLFTVSKLGIDHVLVLDTRNPVSRFGGVLGDVRFKILEILRKIASSVLIFVDGE